MVEIAQDYRIGLISGVENSKGVLLSRWLKVLAAMEGSRVLLLTLAREGYSTVCVCLHVCFSVTT